MTARRAGPAQIMSGINARLEKELKHLWERRLKAAENIRVCKPLLQRFCLWWEDKWSFLREYFQILKTAERAFAGGTRYALLHTEDDTHTHIPLDCNYS